MTREEILQIAKPILFNTEMVRAILEDRKTATRRLIKPPYFVDGDENNPGSLLVMRTAPKGSKIYRQIGKMSYPDKPYKIGDYLYVRETWCNVNKPECEPDYYYFSDTRICEDYDSTEWTWRPSIHMPKEAARIFLKVTDVRFERLQDMDTPNKEHFVAEGAKDKHDFIRIWYETMKLDEREKYGWYADPWVWVIEFERVEV